MAAAALSTMLALLLTLLPARAAKWPSWQLPAPLQSAGTTDLIYPNWFAGRWRVSSEASAKGTAHPDAADRDPADGDAADSSLTYPARFRAAGVDNVVGDRAFNATAVGRAVLGDALLRVDNDPANPNRQLARLRGEQWLESTVIARRSEQADGSFWADELALQVVHGAEGAPRVSRVETLSRYTLQRDGWIAGEQWQATYPSPAEGLQAAPRRSDHWRITLTPDPPESDRAS